MILHQNAGETDVIERLPALPHTVYFVTKYVQKWNDVIGVDNPPSIEAVYDRFTGAEDNWPVHTYLQLRHRGLDVHLVPRYVKGQICVTSYELLRISDLSYNSYVVACRHDRGRPAICEQRVVQNELNIDDETDHFVPHWPQPNLKPRDPARGQRIENLVYKGREIYLAEPFRSQDFLAELKLMGVRLLTSESRYGRDMNNWHDYRHADVVIAVRDCTKYDLSIKPASKLVNAWLAGCPAILGPEPAFQALRESELDYFEVRSAEQAIDAIRRLKNEPGLYDAMVDHGRKRVKNYTSDQTARRWRDLLAGPVASGYEVWLNHSRWWKAVGWPVQHVVRSIRHLQEKKRHYRDVRRGERGYDLY